MIALDQSESAKAQWEGPAASSTDNGLLSDTGVIRGYQALLYVTGRSLGKKGY